MHLKRVVRLIAIFLISMLVVAVLATVWFFIKKVEEAQSNVVSTPFEIQAQTSFLRMEVALLQQQLEDMNNAQEMLSYDTFLQRQQFISQRLSTVLFLLEHLDRPINVSSFSSEPVKEAIDLVAMHDAHLHLIIANYDGVNFESFIQEAGEELMDLKIASTFLFSSASELLQRTSSHAVRQLSTLALVISAMSVIMVLLLSGFAYSLKLVYQQRNRLQLLSHQDELTGLENRRSFNRILDEQIKQARAEQSALSLMVLDVDYFKSYNDNYGHPAGDKVLAAVANRMLACVEGQSVHLFRVGGEEFACIIAQPLPVATALAERLRESIESLRIEHKGSPTFQCLTLSIGCAALIDEPLGMAAQHLFSRADVALYEAKRAGRNQVKCSDSSSN